MYHRPSIRRFLGGVVGARLLFFTAALAGMILLAASGVSQTQSQAKAPQVSAKAGEAYIKVTNPGRNVVWEKGRSYTIRWECRGVRGNVRIFIVSESGTQPPEIKAGGTRQVGNPVIIKVGGLLTLQVSRKRQTRQVSRSIFGKDQFLLWTLPF